MKAVISAVALALGLGGCAIATPFSGADTASATDGKVIVAVTQATLGDDRALRRAFWTNVERVEASLQERPGFIGFSKRQEVFGDVAWTMTAWSDEESLDAFVQSEVHQTAIAEAFDAVEEARFARFEVDRADLPVDWAVALEQLEQNGRGY